MFHILQNFKDCQLWEVWKIVSGRSGEEINEGIDCRGSRYNRDDGEKFEKYKFKHFEN